MPTKKIKKKKVVTKSKKSSSDIVELILKDHMPLKKLIKIMKNTDKDFEARKAAFDEFVPLLTLHARAEEQVLYKFMKANTDQREEGFEGDVEHVLADQVAEEAKRTDDEDMLSARIKVLAELVEHHVEEEEEEMLPRFRKETEVEQREQLGQQYLQKKAKVNQEEVQPALEEEDFEDQLHLS